jgi:hypothetical protein
MNGSAPLGRNYSNARGPSRARFLSDHDLEVPERRSWVPDATAHVRERGPSGKRSPDLPKRGGGRDCDFWTPRQCRHFFGNLRTLALSGGSRRWPGDRPAEGRRRDPRGDALGTHRGVSGKDRGRLLTRRADDARSQPPQPGGLHDPDARPQPPTHSREPSPDAAQDRGRCGCSLVGRMACARATRDDGAQEQTRTG